MKNTAPAKIIFVSSAAGYTMVYTQHSVYVDKDVLGKALWYKKSSDTVETKFLFPQSELMFSHMTLKNLTAGTTYQLRACFYDGMVDDELLSNQINVNLSDTLSIRTKTPPTFTGITVTATTVEVGVSNPTVNFKFTGEADTILIEAQRSGSTEWEGVYSGEFLPTVPLIMPVGTYKFRVSGQIMMPDGINLDKSPVYQYPSDVVVKYLQIPPTKPGAITYKVAKIMDGQERYDVQVSWPWEKLTGPEIKEFILYFVTQDEYSKTGWAKASIVNTSGSRSTVLTGFPFKVPYVFRVAAKVWGPDDTSITYSDASTFEINESTSLDSSFTRQTGVEVTYAGIKALMNDNGNWRQTFLLDARTGALSVGLLENGQAPMTFDPVTKRLNINGKVITNDINAANFILTNLGNGSPKLYSQEKPAFGNANEGIFMGYSATGRFQMDIGNSVNYMRWDNGKLTLSGSITIAKGDGSTGSLEGIIDQASGKPQGMFSLATGNGVWSDSTANQFFLDNFSGKQQQKFTVLTIYKATDRYVATTKMWNGSAWVAPGVTVHGDMIAYGTIRAEQMVADNAFFAKAGINVIYDRNAALSGNPEGTYRMKIDLWNGFIHIR